MTNLDLTPLFRTTIGFDRLAQLANAAMDPASVPGFPPYNIEKLSENDYRLTLAVAGFSPNDIEIITQDGVLNIKGRVKTDADASRMLHRGIATRAFDRRFTLADHMVVEGAGMENGLLHVSLRRVIPEALKPRRIDIRTSGDVPEQPKALLDKAA